MNKFADLQTHVSTLRLWQLISPALPIGAYSYSQGLEYAVECGRVKDEPSAHQWITGILDHSLGRLDLPVLARQYNAWHKEDFTALFYWNQFLLASRESSELKNEDIYLGGSLKKLLCDLDIAPAQQWPDDRANPFINMFALAAVNWNIPLQETAMGYAWAWIENQVAAAIKLIPLGQVAGQRILSSALENVPLIVGNALSFADEDIGAVAPGLAIASALHETQYTRLFRS